MQHIIDTSKFWSRMDDNDLEVKRVEKGSPVTQNFFTLCRVETKDQQNLVDKITASFGNWIDYQRYLDEFYKLSMSLGLFRNWEMENDVVLVGRTVDAQRKANNLANTGVINYTALGTGTTPVSDSDTQLDTEVYRKTVSAATSNNDTAYISTFFTQAETNGTYEEYGNFMDGSGTANSGTLFNRFLEQKSKSNLETLTVQTNITYT